MDELLASLKAKWKGLTPLAQGAIGAGTVILTLALLPSLLGVLILTGIFTLAYVAILK